MKEQFRTKNFSAENIKMIENHGDSQENVHLLDMERKRLQKELASAKNEKNKTFFESKPFTQHYRVQQARLEAKREVFKDMDEYLDYRSVDNKTYKEIKQKHLANTQTQKPIDEKKMKEWCLKDIETRHRKKCMESLREGDITHFCTLKEGHKGEHHSHGTYGGFKCKTWEQKKKYDTYDE